MKTVLLTLALLSLALVSKAQDASVERSISGIQVGFLGIWAHNEARLSNKLALRSEAGFTSGIFGGSFYDKTGFILTPMFFLEPKLYYNLNKRSLKSKEISGNSGNFISLRTAYIPDWFVISNYDNINVLHQVTIIPTWGIRRNIGAHFNYETGVGLGYRHVFAKGAGYSENTREVEFDLRLRIGYRF
ncbi:hypothetical protein K3G39_14610 [Pontibacter sp. HSC-14F20]|uniref:hypothetical protein n=1 Tax=Pontibacter sp. HSC-14F20 TaxID=2864136 RepID=UPI001C73DBD8|nr:hypothetical protein [Pontibacter sp. HSC-14F20]MBX0334471.1 hypothetical protein [Pontibacter sp. HSC-14F20]